jgi:hypothetical protein
MTNNPNGPEGIQINELENKPPAPLVVDLPDGQKLMVGALPVGTIVEIATWRGTSRPDNRTTRLLLGVTNDNSDKSESEGAISAVAKPKIDRRVKASRKMGVPSWLRGVLVTALVLSALAVAIKVSPLQIVHPTMGASAGFGTADSALVLSNPQSKYDKGAVVVAHLGDEDNTVLLGTVVQSVEESVLLSTGQGFAQTDSKKVIGKVVIVIPFIGKLFN